MVKLSKEDYDKMSNEEKQHFVCRSEAVKALKISHVSLFKKCDLGEIDYYYTDEVGENARNDRKFNVGKYLHLINTSVDLLSKSYPDIPILKYFNKGLNYTEEDLKQITNFFDVYKEYMEQINEDHIKEEHIKEETNIKIGEEQEASDTEYEEVEENKDAGNGEKEKLFHYIYLVRKPDLTLHDDKIYKIGKTKQKASNVIGRVRSYGLGTEIYMIMQCKDSTICESKVLEVFNKRFKRYKFGKESFEGNIEEMKAVIYEMCKLY